MMVVRRDQGRDWNDRMDLDTVLPVEVEVRKLWRVGDLLHLLLPLPLLPRRCLSPPHEPTYRHRRPRPCPHPHNPVRIRTQTQTQMRKSKLPPGPASARISTHLWAIYPVARLSSARPSPLRVQVREAGKAKGRGRGGGREGGMMDKGWDRGDIGGLPLFLGCLRMGRVVAGVGGESWLRRRRCIRLV
jgi:hypothetical protein